MNAASDVLCQCSTKVEISRAKLRRRIEQGQNIGL